MPREQFWRKGQYPTTPPSDKPQPSDNERWEQLMEFWRLRHLPYTPPTDRRTKPL